MGHRLRGTEGLDDGAGGPATLVGQNAAKAYSLFDQRGSILGVNTAGSDSLNISSITDDAAGRIIQSTSSSMSSSQYSIAATTHYSGVSASSTIDFSGPSAQNTGDCEFSNSYQNGGLRDGIYWQQIFGDLA